MAKRLVKEVGDEGYSRASPLQGVMQSKSSDAANARSTEADLRRDVLIADIVQRTRRPLTEIPAGVQPPSTTERQTTDSGLRSRPTYPEKKLTSRKINI